MTLRTRSGGVVWTRFAVLGGGEKIRSSLILLRQCSSIRVSQIASTRHLSFCAKSFTRATGSLSEPEPESTPLLLTSSALPAMLASSAALPFNSVTCVWLRIPLTTSLRNWVAPPPTGSSTTGLRL